MCVGSKRYKHKNYRLWASLGRGTFSLFITFDLEARTDAAIAMRHLLFAGSVVIASASGGVSDKEIEVFEQFFQKGDFSDKLNVERIREDLSSRIERVNQQTTHSQRMQELRDLCLIAKAEGKATDEERAVLYQIADGLQLSRNFVCQSLELECEPD